MIKQPTANRSLSEHSVKIMAAVKNPTSPWAKLSQIAFAKGSPGLRSFKSPSQQVTVVITLSTALTTQFLWTIITKLLKKPQSVALFARCVNKQKPDDVSLFCCVARKFRYVLFTFSVCSVNFFSLSFNWNVKRLLKVLDIIPSISVFVVVNLKVFQALSSHKMKTIFLSRCLEKREFQTFFMQSMHEFFLSTSRTHACILFMTEYFYRLCSQSFNFDVVWTLQQSFTASRYNEWNELVIDLADVIWGLLINDVTGKN